MGWDVGTVVSRWVGRSVVVDHEEAGALGLEHPALVFPHPEGVVELLPADPELRLSGGSGLAPGRAVARGDFLRLLLARVEVVLAVLDEAVEGLADGRLVG